MDILVGTSGWSYKEWKGSFYPPKLPAEEMLRFYAGHFPAVEVNNSFYRIPAERVLATWAEQVPPTFRFVLKASRRITHNHRLADDDGSLDYFLRAVNPLGDRLGPTLFQLPPTFKKDLDRLRGFLERLPRRWPAAMEFRHASWFTEEVYDLLRARDVALVAVDADEAEGGASPWWLPRPGATSDCGGPPTTRPLSRAGLGLSGTTPGARRMYFSSTRTEAPPALPPQVRWVRSSPKSPQSDLGHDRTGAQGANMSVR